MALKEFYDYIGQPDPSIVEKVYHLFHKHGSDKSSRHNYEVIYGPILERSEIKNVFEIGVAQGGSARAWAEYSDDIFVYGIDNNPEHMFKEKNIEIFLADQSDVSTISEVYLSIQSPEFNLIVDDGSHQLKHAVDTFNECLPWLSLDGWYVVEDIPLVNENDWLLIKNNLSDNYKSFLINLNSMVDMDNDDLKDNILFIVKRVK